MQAFDLLLLADDLAEMHRAAQAVLPGELLQLRQHPGAAIVRGVGGDHHPDAVILGAVEAFYQSAGAGKEGLAEFPVEPVGAAADFGGDSIAGA